MAEVLPEQQLPFGPAGFVNPAMVAPAGFEMNFEGKAETSPVAVQSESVQTPTSEPAMPPMQQMQAQQTPQQMQGQQMQGQPMQPQQMQGQMQPQMQGQQMMVMQTMQQGVQQMPSSNGAAMPQMMQQFVPMAMPAGFDQSWGQGMQFGQAPAGWVFVPMAAMGDGQQMMFDGSQMGNQQMFYGGMPQQQQNIPHVYLRPNQDDMGRRGGKQWRGRRKDGDGRRNYNGESHKVFVGGLGPATSAKTLRQYFSQFGMLVDAAVIADGATRRSRGFGFVEFQGGIPDGVLDHEHLIENRRCGVRPYTYRSAPSGPSGSDRSD